MSKHDIVDRLKAAVEQEETASHSEVQALLLKAAETIEFLRSLLEPLQDIELEDLPPKGSA
jgi:hypothetical protein